MKKFQQVSVKIEFTLLATTEIELREIADILEKKQWGFLLGVAADNNMSVNRPDISLRVNSEDSY